MAFPLPPLARPGQLAAALFAVIAVTGLAMAAANAEPQRFVVRSDTQYDRTDDGSDDPKALLREQGNAINAWRNSQKGSIPIFINGDITEFGHGWQWSVMKDHLATTPNTYWGLGNHDYDNNVNDCAANGCARDSLLHLVQAVKGWNVDAFDYVEHRDRRHAGSFAYSKTIGDITFIQLNNHYAYKVKFESRPFLKPHHFFDVTPSLDWLERQLKQAEKEKKFVVVNLHRPPGDHGGTGSPAEYARFRQLVERYRVLAVFHGHTHAAGVRPSIGEVPVLDSGASFRRTFLTAALDRQADTFSVALARQNRPESEPMVSIPLTTLATPVFESKVATDGRTIAGHFFLGDNPRDKAIGWLEVTLNGRSYSLAVNSNVSTVISGLAPNTDYSYTLNAYRVKGGKLEGTRTGSFRTIQSDGGEARDLCIGFWAADSGWFELEWKDPILTFARPYAIIIEASERGKPVWTIRGVEQMSVSTRQRIEYQRAGRDPFAMDYKIKYWSSRDGHGPEATLRGSDLLSSGCQRSTDE